VNDRSSAADAPQVWAIVLIYGEEAEAAECIASLAKQDHRNLKVLLVDNKADDGCGARLRARFPSIDYLDTGGNLGYAGGNNRGIARAVDAGADYVFVLNNDTVVEPDCVSKLVDMARQSESVGMVAPKILYHDDRSVIWYAGGSHSLVKGLGDHLRQHERDTPGNGEVPAEISFVTGCAFLMPANVAREVTGFAEDFFIYCEDVELSLRLRLAGYRLYYQPAARLYHKEPRVSNPSAFQIRLRDRNRRRLVRRHYGALDKLRFAAWFYPTRVARFVQYAALGDWERANAIVAGAIER
jgi:GT2 family glycosyltransferase